MSFHIDAFDNVTSGMSKGPKIWSYSSDTDTLAEILAADYFEEVKERIYKNDLIYVAASDDVELIKVTSENGQTPTTAVFVPASGGAPSDATYITQTPNIDLSAEQALSLLPGGIMKSAAVTGVIDTATANVDYQVGSPALTSIASLTTAADEMIYTTASNTYTTTGLTAAGRALLDDATAGDQRNSLGLGTIATQNSNNVTITGGSITGITDLAIADGGTAASTNTSAINNLVSGASLTTATVAGTDLVLIQDASDANNLKSVTAQSIADLTAGTVTSVSGTAGRITSSGGATPVIDIDATYVGQGSITTLGTVTSGLIQPGAGGTGVVNTGTITVGGNTAFSGAFTFTGTITGNTAVTFPTSGTLQTTANASGIVNSGTANQIAYYATSTNAVSGLTGANGSVLVTNNTGVPSMLANPSADNRHLASSNGDTPAWSRSSYADTYSVSTILYASATNTVTGLATTNRASLSTNSTGVPTWLALTDGQVVIGSSAGSPSAATLTQGTGITITSASNSITIASTVSSAVVSTQVNLSSTDFAGIYATPLQIVAAQGANTFIQVINVTINKVIGATVYTGGGVVGLQYGTTNHLGGVAITTTIPANNFTSGGVANENALYTFTGTAPLVQLTSTLANSGIYISNATGAFASGSGNVYVTVNYIVITTH